MAQYQVERIRNGLIVADADDKTYYPTFDEMIEGVTEELRARYKDALHHEWDGKFSLTIEADGL